jgi:hypothetical protein
MEDCTKEKAYRGLHGCADLEQATTTAAKATATADPYGMTNKKAKRRPKQKGEKTGKATANADPYGMTSKRQQHRQKQRRRQIPTG